MNVSNAHSGSPVERCAGSCPPTVAVPPDRRRKARAASRDRVAARDVRVLRTLSFTADREISAIMPDGTVLRVFHSVCTGSADGHCQAIDVFRDNGRKPIWHRQYQGVLRLESRRRGFAVEAVSYGPQDPLCCPSLPPVHDTYTWTGRGFREAGPLPGSPTG